MGEFFVGLDVIVALFTAGYLVKILFGEFEVFKQLSSLASEKRSLQNQHVLRRLCQ